MITVSIWYYSLDPDFEEGPGTLDRFELEASTGERREYLQGTPEEINKDVEEFLTWVRQRHPGESVEMDCTIID